MRLYGGAWGYMVVERWPYSKQSQVFLLFLLTFHFDFFLTWLDFRLTIEARKPLYIQNKARKPLFIQNEARKPLFNHNQIEARKLLSLEIWKPMLI